MIIFSVFTRFIFVAEQNAGIKCVLLPPEESTTIIQTVSPSSASPFAPSSSAQLIMKFTGLALAALVPFVALSAPTAEPEGALLYAPAVPGELPTLKDLSARSLEKRAITGKTTTDLKHRRCPKTTSACTADGQFGKNKNIKIKCFRDWDTSKVEGDPYVALDLIRR
jgi:hypothetical protein